LFAESHDLAVTNVTSSKTVVGQGFSITINVTIQNQGNLGETITISNFSNQTLLLNQSTYLPPRTQTNLTFTWNTTDFAKGNYTISAVAEQVLGEIDLDDNNCTDGWILITKVGDLGGGVPPEFFNFDGKVDSKDLALFLQCYKGLGPPNAMYLGDLGGGLPPQFYRCDGKVDSKDLSLFLMCFKGQGPPDP
jgi:hypothetical protein